MLTIGHVVDAPETKLCLDMDWPETPIYVRVPGTPPRLLALDSIRAGEIETTAGGRHSVLILEASDVTAEETP